MNLCTRCRGISLTSLMTKEGHLLHDCWSSLESSARDCPLCMLILGVMKEAIQLERQDTLRGSDESAYFHPQSTISLRYSLPEIWEDVAEPGKQKRIRNRADDTSHLSVLPRYPQGANYHPSPLPLVVYVHPSDPLTAIGLHERHPLAVDPMDASVVAGVRSWVKACSQNHVECEIDPSVAIVLPQRLLYLGDIHSKGVLTIYNVPSSFKSEYVTLSYCWGPIPDQRWIDYLYEVQAKNDSVELSLMPKTLRDAVTVTFTLGYDYLWIDCLCILQHNPTDWRNESAKMSNIYECSALTISASDTARCSDGFLALRNHTQVNGIPLTLSTEDGQSGTLRISPHESYMSFASTVRRGPVSKRAWCLQERRLASRVLHMCHHQIVYECAKVRHVESEVCPAEDFVQDEDQLFRIPRNGSSELSRGKASAKVGNILQWYAIVEDYMTRNLTVASDKLVAIAGLAETANRYLRSRYLAGLWEKQVHVGLCWEIAEEGKGRSLNRCAQYRAPSWSWASVDGEISWRIDGWVQSEDGFLESAIQLLGFDLQVDKETPYEQVKSGSMTVKGRAKRIPTKYLLENEVLSYPTWMSGTTQYVGYYMEDEKKTLTGEVYCLKVAMRPYGQGPSIPPTNCMLVLQPTPENTYTRLGYGQVMETSFFDDTPPQILKLV